MDPHSGRIYASPEDARADGVEHPLEVFGRPEDVQRTSDALGRLNRAERRAAEKAARRQRTTTTTEQDRSTTP